MKLLTKKDLKNIPDIYSTENTSMKETMVYAKFFTPDSSWSWYLMELSKKDNDMAFGLIDGLEKEYGYFSISELEETKGPLGLHIERDIRFKPMKLKDIQGL